MDDICRILWCGNGGSTISTAHPALEGSWCGHNKVRRLRSLENITNPTSLLFSSGATKAVVEVGPTLRWNPLNASTEGGRIGVAGRSNAPFSSVKSLEVSPSERSTGIASIRRRLLDIYDIVNISISRMKSIYQLYNLLVRVFDDFETGTGKCFQNLAQITAVVRAKAHPFVVWFAVLLKAAAEVSLDRSSPTKSAARSSTIPTSPICN